MDRQRFTCVQTRMRFTLSATSRRVRTAAAVTLLTQAGAFHPVQTSPMGLEITSKCFVLPRSHLILRWTLQALSSTITQTIWSVHRQQPTRSTLFCPRIYVALTDLVPLLHFDTLHVMTQGTCSPSIPALTAQAPS